MPTVCEMRLSAVPLLLALVFAQGALACGPGPFDYLMLVLSWPATFCATTDDCVVPTAVGQNFTLHGMWPSDVVPANATEPEYPCYCTNEPFSMSAVQDLEPRLEVLWPEMKTSRAHDYLWDHEWTKHGTCAVADDATTFADQHDYFLKTLNLAEQLMPTQPMQAAGVTATTSSQQLTDVLQGAFGQRPLLECVGGQGGQMLDSVTFCVDKSGALAACTPGVFSAADDICSESGDISLPKWSSASTKEAIAHK